MAPAGQPYRLKWRLAKSVTRTVIPASVASNFSAVFSQSAWAWKREVSPTVSPVAELPTAAEDERPVLALDPGDDRDRTGGDPDEFLHLVVEDVGGDGSGPRVADDFQAIVVAQGDRRPAVGRDILGEVRRLAGGRDRRLAAAAGQEQGRAGENPGKESLHGPGPGRPQEVGERLEAMSVR